MTWLARHAGGELVDLERLAPGRLAHQGERLLGALGDTRATSHTLSAVHDDGFPVHR
jgi:hypothetical protein